MTVIVRKEWLREYGRTERLGRVRAAVNWQGVYHYGWLLAIAFITVVFFIWQNVKIISSGYEIEELKRRLNEAQSQNSLLTVEAASLGDLSVIEQRAAYELGMVKPVPGQVLYARQIRKAATDGQPQNSLAYAGN